MSRLRAEQALSDYLDRLLQPEAAQTKRPLAEPEPAPTGLLPAARTRLQQLLDQVAEVPAAATETLTAAGVPSVLAATTATRSPTAVAADVVAAAPTRAPAPAPAPVPEPIPVPVSAVALAVAEAGAVAYSNEQYRRDLPQRFPTLVFRIDDLKLALPLHLLGGIQRRDKPLTPLVGRADWFLGLLPHEPENLNVVDTGRYLLADKYRPELVDGYRYVIRIGDTAWGLACTDLCATRNLSQDDVRWYDSNPRRPWLAGMIKEDRCALLNPEALVAALAQHGRRAA